MTADLPCPHCGRVNRADAAFCDACGMRLAPPAPHAAVAPAIVGRANVLTAIDALLARLADGHGAIVALAGEPGIGKSHTAHAIVGGAGSTTALWARCNEEPGAPPYWPWLQLLRAWLGSHDDAVVRETLGTSASAIAEILPEIGPHVATATPVPAARDPQQERFRLFDAIHGFLRRAAAHSPLLLAIDDLHWADASSLRLLEFLAPDLDASRILLLVTYRDIELNRRHPLSGALGDLARHRHFHRFRLTGLTRDETAVLVAQAGGGALTPAMLDAIHAQTEGNPLFIVETTRLLVQDTTFGSRHGEPPGAAPGIVAIRIPEGVKEVIGRRLNRLSPQANRVLTSAALVGRSFDLALLERLLDRPLVGGLARTIAEALEGGILEPGDTPGRYQFSHALIRETLYDEIAIPTRSRMHLEVAQAIESLHGSDDASRLPALAYHYASALPGGDPAHAADIARRAAERATRLLAHEEAARYYRLALQAIDAIGANRAASDAIARSTLLNALGEALTSAGEYLTARDAFQQAAVVAQHGATRDAQALDEQAVEQIARAALGFETASWAPGLPGLAAARMLRAALAAQGSGATTTKARLLSALVRALIFSGEDAQALIVREQAVDMARRSGDTATLVATLVATLSTRWQPERSAQRLRDAEDASRLAEGIGDVAHALEAQAWQLFEYMEIGDLPRWRSRLERYERRAAELGQPFARYVAATSHATYALLQGRFDEAESLIARALQIGRRMPGLDAAGVYGMQMFTLRSEQGRLRDLAPVLRAFVAATPATGTWRPGLALLYTELAMMDEARREFEALAADDFAVVRRDGLRAASLAYLAQVCATLGDTARAPVLYALLLPYDGRNLLIGTTVGCLGAAASLLGMLAATERRWPDAQRHHVAAIEMNERQGAAPALAHARARYAAMLLARNEAGDDAAARALLTEASADALRLGMRALQERVAALQASLPNPVACSAAAPAGLSEREVQVLQLVASGLANRAIAQRLFVSPNTVANHVRAILAKTGCANRTEAATFAIRHGLAPSSDPSSSLDARLSQRLPASSGSPHAQRERRRTET